MNSILNRSVHTISWKQFQNTYAVILHIDTEHMNFIYGPVE